jgi:hypothetical protein
VNARCWDFEMPCGTRQYGTREGFCRKKLGAHGTRRTLPGRATSEVRVARLDLRFDEHRKISDRSGERRELGIEAKVCELSDEAIAHVLGAAVEMVGNPGIACRP